MRHVNYSKILFKITAVSASLALMAYWSIITYFLVGWFVDDSEAFKMKTMDWAFMVIARVIESSLCSLILVVIIYFLLRLAWGWRSSGGRKQLPFMFAVLSWALFVAIAASSGLKFFMTRPYM